LNVPLSQKAIDEADYCKNCFPEGGGQAEMEHLFSAIDQRFRQAGRAVAEGT
jgi:hypothetical protein